jgi:hypothetical protein
MYRFAGAIACTPAAKESLRAKPDRAGGTGCGRLVLECAMLCLIPLP